MKLPKWKFVPLKSWLDLESVPGFIQGVAPSARMIQGQLVQDYEMPLAQGERPCGISECRSGHRRGWLVRLPDGHLSHVGKDCGKTHFGAEWSRQIKQFRADKKSAAQALSLEEARTDVARFIAELLPLSVAEIDELKAMRAAIDELPAQVRDSLEARANDGNPRLYDFRPPTEAEIRMAKFLKQRRPDTVQQEVGKFRGLNALRPSQSISSALDRIERQKKNLQAMTNSANADEIRAQSNRLRDMRAELRIIQQQWRLFFEPSNIAQLIYLHQVQKLYTREVRLSVDRWPRIVIVRAGS